VVYGNQVMYSWIPILWTSKRNENIGLKNWVVLEIGSAYSIGVRVGKQLLVGVIRKFENQGFKKPGLHCLWRLLSTSIIFLFCSGIQFLLLTNSYYNNVLFRVFFLKVINKTSFHWLNLGCHKVLSHLLSESLHPDQTCYIVGEFYQLLASSPITLSANLYSMRSYNGCYRLQLLITFSECLKFPSACTSVYKLAT